MANTRVQSEVEEWVRSNWMPEHLGIESSRRDLVLASGGKCSFDAVSVDGKVVAMISTSSHLPTGGLRDRALRVGERVGKQASAQRTLA